MEPLAARGGGTSGIALAVRGLQPAVSLCGPLASTARAGPLSPSPVGGEGEERGPRQRLRTRRRPRDGSVFLRLASPASPEAAPQPWAPRTRRRPSFEVSSAAGGGCARGGGGVQPTLSARPGGGHAPPQVPMAKETLVSGRDPLPNEPRKEQGWGGEGQPSKDPWTRAGARRCVRCSERLGCLERAGELFSVVSPWRHHV